MPVYRTSGKLTGAIERDNLEAAQRYLREDSKGAPINMQQYLDPPLAGVVELLEWSLEGDGRSYTVTAFASRELDEAELKQLASEVSGQNSDGLGEGFEQQDFAWDDAGDCGDCKDCEEGYSCGMDEGRMISFDWQTNNSRFERL